MVGIALQDNTSCRRDLSHPPRPWLSLQAGEARLRATGFSRAGPRADR